VVSTAQCTPVPPFSFHGVLFRHYSEDWNAGVQLRLPVNAAYRGPAVDNAATSRVAGTPRLPPSRHPFLPILFLAREALYPRQRFLPHHVAATRRVSLTSSTSLWVRGYVCNVRNVLVPRTHDDNR